MTEEEKVAIQFKYEKIQENDKFIYSRIREDEAQRELLDFLADFRQMSPKILEEAEVFYIENRKEIDYLTGFDEDAQYYLGFMNRNVNYEGRFVFPVRNGKGELNAWIGYDPDSKSKYLVGLLGVGDKKKLLYGIHDLDQAYEEDTIAVFEGSFERNRLKEIGVNIGVSLLGKKMSKWQKQFINRFKNIILIPDADQEGQDMINQWKQDLKGNICLIKLYEEAGKFYVGDEWIEKRIKDMDDKLRDNPEKVRAFLELYEVIKERFKTENYFEVKF